MFLLVPAYPGSTGPKAVKRLCVCVFGYPCPQSGGCTEWGGGNVSCTVCLSVCLFVNSITEKLMVVFCKILEVDIIWDSEKSWLNFAT